MTANRPVKTAKDDSISLYGLGVLLALLFATSLLGLAIWWFVRAAVQAIEFIQRYNELRGAF